MPSSAPKYTHQSYGTGFAIAATQEHADELLDKMTKALSKSMQTTKETVMANLLAPANVVFSLTSKGKLQLAARSQYHTGNTFRLAVYALVTDDTVKSKSVRQWERKEEEMFVPCTTTHSEQDRLLRFMCDIVSTRAGIDYVLRQAPSTRKPVKTTGVIPVDNEIMKGMTWQNY
ncbi:hypothetical protein UFOVP228_31 [uncultured Caudovirales phage]|uniref:Uncharacterized protein n=1 Tax=uncultured Caudovirales phage TaxID=2100421 RepID=A0A6J5TB97_9CAUD|nr:hypothetical protein UFOVP47_71 [uncultured Caudovirales phage]CAB5219150.1 hypothetical protein UFOVP228_31 [uncultured Caudovirales phage]